MASVDCGGGSRRKEEKPGSLAYLRISELWDH